MKIGVDFGTTYTKIAFLKPPENRLELFRYPPPPGDKQYVPTAVAYRRQHGQPVISIGEAARNDAIDLPDTIFCENFKLLLQLPPDQWPAHGWKSDTSPAEVTRDYFRLLLREIEGNFEATHGPIESLVVSVPEVWQRTVNPGAATLQRILMDELHLPVDQLCSEPICAAACYVYAYQQTEHRAVQPFNLLVCDMGGGTFDLVLCRVVPLPQGYQIHVLDFDGNGQAGLGSAGVAFDHSVVQYAHTRTPHGSVLPDARDFVELVRAFETVKIHKHAETKGLFDLLRRSPAHTASLADTPLYQWRRKYEVTLAQVQACFAPIRAGIEAVLQRLLTRAAQQQWPIEQVALVGGFSQFPLVEQTILDCIGIQDAADDRFSSTLNSYEHRFYAVARGAALIAHGVIQVVDYYPHTLEIIVHRERPTLAELALPLVEAGRMQAGRARPYYAQQAGKEVIIAVPRQEYGRLPVRLRLLGTGKPLELTLPEADYPPPGRYRIGVLVDRSNLGTLVFDPVEGGTPLRYPLGDVSPPLVMEEA